jgi:hypothetical protein
VKNALAAKSGTESNEFVSEIEGGGLAVLTWRHAFSVSPAN